MITKLNADAFAFKAFGSNYTPNWNQNWLPDDNYPQHYPSTLCLLLSQQETIGENCFIFERERENQVSFNYTADIALG